MSDFQSRFDQHVAEANSAAANNTTALAAHALALHPAHIRRLLDNIRKMLGHVDRKKTKHPEFLAAAPTTIPEKAIELVASVKGSFDAGLEHFVQNTLPALVDVEQRLIKSVGSEAFNIQDIKNSQVRSLNKIVDQAQLSGNKISVSAKNLEDIRTASSANVDNIKQFLEQAAADQKKISDTWKAAEKLARGNPTQNSLESLVRKAREKSDEIDELLSKITESEKKSKAAADNSKQFEIESNSVKSALEEANKKALGILNNATQAGLAGAYKTERDNLKKEQRIFSFVFYGIIGLIILYAAVFILPIVNEIFKEKTSTELAIKENSLLLLVRFLILTPAVWALIFTNKRYVYLEALQMDYAAKANTALAYSGYRDEMLDDGELSKLLKDGLLQRFLEHPSRLLKGSEAGSSFLGIKSNNDQKRSQNGDVSGVDESSKIGE